MCDCKSYNRPDWGGTMQEVVVSVPLHLQSDGRATVCLDLCIAPAVLSLWAAGVKTYGSCCGHNGNAPRMIMIGEDDLGLAQSSLGEEAVRLAYWKDGVLQ